jgi:hypothetical protein
MPEHNQAPSESSLRALGRRLREEHERIRGLEASLRGARRRRALLALKLLTGGRTERSVASLIDVDSAHIHQWKIKAQRERETEHA